MFEEVDNEVPWSRWARPAWEAVAVMVLPTLLAGFFSLALSSSEGESIALLILAPLFGLLYGARHGRVSEPRSRVLLWLWVLPFSLLMLGQIWPDPYVTQWGQLKSDLGFDVVDEGFTLLLITSPMLGAAGYAIGRTLTSKRRCQPIQETPLAETEELEEPSAP